MATDSKDALVEPLLPAEAAEVTSDARQRSEASDEEPWLRWLSPIAQKAVALVALLCGVLAWATLVRVRAPLSASTTHQHTHVLGWHASSS